MAEALLPLIGGKQFVAYSAGTNPVGVNACTVTVMAEVGIDISQNRSKHINEYADRRFDYVITVCDRAKESCPIFPAAHKMLHWCFDDPAAAPEREKLETFRRVREEITSAICRFLADEFELSGTVPSSGGLGTTALRA